jgi:hypothetical protein
VKTRTKAEAFLSSLKIGFHTEADEDAVLYAAMVNGRKTKLLSKAAKATFVKQLSRKKQFHE